MVISLYSRKDENAARDGINTHPMRMIKMVFLLTDLTPLSKPFPATAPTIAQDVDIGIPKIGKRWIPKAAET